MPESFLELTYGSLLLMRPPVPLTINRSQGNDPRRAFEEWVSICESIVACGGDALFLFEETDNKLLGHKSLEVDGEGNITPTGSKEVLDTVDNLQTERIFTANGPWVTLKDQELRAMMPHLLPYRGAETHYFDRLLGHLAESSGYRLQVIDNPHRWEGMADVTVIGTQVILSYGVPGHYDDGAEGVGTHSTFEGVAYAADQVGIPESARIYVELASPHAVGDMVHYCLRPQEGAPKLVTFSEGLWGDGATRLEEALSSDSLLPLSGEDALEHCASNSRQVMSGVLIPEKVSFGYEASLEALGLTCTRLSLFELFGPGGGGPGAATLHLPSNLSLADSSPLRFSQQAVAIRERRERLAERVTVAPAFLSGA